MKSIVKDIVDEGFEVRVNNGVFEVCASESEVEYIRNKYGLFNLDLNPYCAIVFKTGAFRG